MYCISFKIGVYINLKYAFVYQAPDMQYYHQIYNNRIKETFIRIPCWIITLYSDLDYAKLDLVGQMSSSDKQACYLKKLFLILTLQNKLYDMLFIQLFFYPIKCFKDKTFLVQK